MKSVFEEEVSHWWYEDVDVLQTVDISDGILFLKVPLWT